MAPELWRACWKIAALELEAPNTKTWDCGDRVCITNGPCAVFLPGPMQVQTEVEPLPGWATPVQELGRTWPVFTFYAKPSRAFVGKLREVIGCDHGALPDGECLLCETDETFFVLGYGFPYVARRYARLLLSLLEACTAPHIVSWAVDLDWHRGEDNRADRCVVFDLEGGPRVVIGAVRVLVADGLREVHRHAV
jgi:hypothetical protein